jgi:UDP-GlcNAc:undecaprenyl-phosphate GlcNAc-1-phosphate transferase
MTTLQIAGVVLASVLVTRIMARLGAALAPRLGLVAQPTPDKNHGRAVPVVGGIAMAAGFLISYGWSCQLVAPVSACTPFLSLIVPLTALPLTAGLMDDRWALRPLPKLLLMMAVAAACALLLHGFAPAACAVWFAILLVAMNSFNLLDNSDGACASTACCCLIVGYCAHQQISSLLMAGALLGFLTLNWPPARIFMGDAGSLLLGVWCATSVLGPAPAWHLLPTLWVPLYDTLSVMAMRLWRGRPVWIGGNDHCAHRLRRAGLPMALVNVLFGGATLAAGCISLRLSTRMGLALTLLLLVGAGIAELVMHHKRMAWRRAQ